MRQVSILFVCHGNICRSPMAEYVLKDLVAKRGISDVFRIESAATSTEEIGNDVHRGTVHILAAHGIDVPHRCARRITREDYENFDVIIGMDDANIRNMKRIFNGDSDGKLHKMMEFAGSDRDVADPWYTGDFQTTFEDISDGCEGLLGWLKKA